MKYQNDFWNRYFKYYDILLKVIPYQELFSRIVSSLEVEQDSKILDLGAGTGNLQMFLPKAANVVSWENHELALKYFFWHYNLERALH